MDAMRERLQGQRYIENTVRALTHELKSPLAAIRGAGELLKEPLAQDDRERFAGHVVEQSDRLHSTVERLLELSKLEQLQAPPAPSAVPVADLLAHTVARTASFATRRGVRVESGPTNIVLSCDAESVQLALDNLVQNAIAFSPEGGVVVVCASEDAPHVHIDVRDDGPGFADFVKDRLGERFVSTARPDGSPKGSGLGWAIAAQVAQLHGGTLSLLRQHPTTVRLTLATRP
jgi:two-component system, OmpR family, sensor histidine kinase CreC